MRITDEHLAHWRQHGYVVVPNFLTEAELVAIQPNVRRYFPTDEEYRTAPERYPDVGGWRELPFIGDALNDLATHPELASFAERVIGTREILLTQAILWGKYAGVGDHEQRLHVAFRAATGARFTFHVVFRAKDSHWMGFSAWARAGQEPALQRFLERATPRQRELLGFPPPGHPYWNEETLAGVAARYPGMDMTLYRDAFR